MRIVLLGVDIYYIIDLFLRNNIMADPVTMSDITALSKDHSDIRREAAEHTNEIVREGMKGDYSTASRVEANADRVVASVNANAMSAADRFFQVGRDTSDLQAQVTALFTTVKETAALTASQNENSVLKNTIEGQKNTQYLADKVGGEGEKTRALINELKYSDLNRQLIERNSALVEEREGGKHWRHLADHNQSQGQWAAVQSQLQAFQSQLQETRQGMVNFGTMAGVGQTSTSNNVR